jgi:hypothetical protein
MASFTVAAGAIACHDKTLGADTVDTVTFTDDVEWVTVWSDGAAEMYFTFDGSAPTVSGANCYHLPAVPSRIEIESLSENVIKLISHGTPKYSIVRMH